MKREYKDGTADDQIYFTGVEVENTAAKGMETLFVVGVPDLTEILSKANLIHRCRHIYLGANQSFLPNPELTPAEQYDEWHHVIQGLLDLDYWVTLDFDSKFHVFVLEASWNESDRFIPMISVKLPMMQLLNYNACLKLDDIDFRATNEGVWVHSVHSLKSREAFTDWSKYTNDVQINQD